MGEIIILDQSKADELLSLGFKYVKRIVDGKQVFVFIQTNELMKELNSRFDNGSFAISNTVNF